MALWAGGSSEGVSSQLSHSGDDLLQILSRTATRTPTTLTCPLFQKTYRTSDGSFSFCTYLIFLLEGIGIRAHSLEHLRSLVINEMKCAKYRRGIAFMGDEEKSRKETKSWYKLCWERLGSHTGSASMFNPRAESSQCQSQQPGPWKEGRGLKWG